MQVLKPFGTSSAKFEIRGDLSFEAGGMKCRFELKDPHGQVIDGPQKAVYEGSVMKRADGLWQTTCFEVFWGVPGSTAYWELNMAPYAGLWNLYAFDDYRLPQPPQVSKAFAIEQVRVTDSTLECDLSGPSGPFEASLCAVIRTKDATYYCSTKHAGVKADFHLRESFSNQNIGR
ncbi:MAG: hypothetical protein KF799_12400 [Bdellovibrionales bacterium]|nr:hypothetical protein [Bdellovibrionales bacterium]